MNNLNEDEQLKLMRGGWRRCTSMINISILKKEKTFSKQHRLIVIAQSSSYLSSTSCEEAIGHAFRVVKVVEVVLNTLIINILRAFLHVSANWRHVDGICLDVPDREIIQK